MNRYLIFLCLRNFPLDCTNFKMHTANKVNENGGDHWEGSRCCPRERSLTLFQAQTSTRKKRTYHVSDWTGLAQANQAGPSLTIQMLRDMITSIPQFGCRTFLNVVYVSVLIISSSGQSVEIDTHELYKLALSQLRP